MLPNPRLQAAAFGPSGRLDYTPEPGKLDYGRTHFESHANGYGARELVAILASAAITGDLDLRRGALDLLERQDAQYRHDVPRGAQTWEIPLHTPDILAAALLTHAFVLGYELSGDPRHLEAAVEWAWSGLSFVYLTPPTQRAIGLYATIPVLGATDWDRLNWIGRPVQWCGLVYADALFKLHRHDSSAPWRKIARGIIVTGLAMVNPQGSDPLTGLLDRRSQQAVVAGESGGVEDIRQGDLMPELLEAPDIRPGAPDLGRGPIDLALIGRLVPAVPVAIDGQPRSVEVVQVAAGEGDTRAGHGRRLR